jgi:predicted O-linked N-acetylglucosamine transferase (SPINDLY family)
VLCDWSSFEEDSREIARQIEAGRAVTSPFPLAAIPATPALLQRCAELYTRQLYPPVPAEPAPATAGSGRLRIGYFSADYHNHATAYLAAGLFERHDRDRFEIFAFSFGPDRKDEMRQRLVRGFDHFLDVRDRTDADIRRLARAHGIQIAVDLKGHTLDQRTGIFAGRAAPIQVNYLGYPGTMGAPYIDYVLADATVLPPEHQPFYTEKAVWLPDSYQVNDSRRTPPRTAGTRAEHGLPDDAFVFCSFNNPYKITPDAFAAWMQILQRCPGSVLWLLEAAPETGANLRQAAARHGIDAGRLIFARHAEITAHVNRQRHADLFLDTFHYNAHTTAADALWAGLPLLTRLGNTFAGRVAASLLRAAGLPELVTASTEEYIALAVALHADRDRLTVLREKLEAGRATCALFDTARFCRGVEAAYLAMWQRHQAGLPPDAIDIPRQA